MLIDQDKTVVRFANNISIAKLTNQAQIAKLLFVPDTDLPVMGCRLRGSSWRFDVIGTAGRRIALKTIRARGLFRLLFNFKIRNRLG